MEHYDFHKTNEVLRKVLRHQPESIGLELDKSGWASVNDLLERMNKTGIPMNLEILKKIVNASKRYSFYDKKCQKVRATYGHSLGIALKDLVGDSSKPPKVLYHGTQLYALSRILISGIKKQKRDHVFLTENIDIALKRGEYHGKMPIALVVDAKQMDTDGIPFYYVQDGVWLIDSIPAKYMTKIKYHNYT